MRKNAPTQETEKLINRGECISKEPQLEDDVFLIKLRQEPRGIVGHGRVGENESSKYWLGVLNSLKKRETVPNSV